MGILDPKSWSKEGFAQWSYDTLNPVFGEDAPLEDVADKVREGDIVGAGVEATTEIFVDPIVDTGKDAVVGVAEDVIETGKDAYEANIDTITAGFQSAKDSATLALVAIGALFFLSKR